MIYANPTFAELNNLLMLRLPEKVDTEVVIDGRNSIY